MKIIENALSLVNPKDNYILVEIDEETDMAAVSLNGTCIYEGNFWDYHPGCFGIEDLEFEDHDEFVDELIRNLYLNTKQNKEYSEATFVVTGRTYKYES